MGVSAASDRMAVRCLAGTVPCPSSPVQVVIDRLDAGIGVGVVIFPGPSLAMRTRDDVPQVSGHGIDREVVTNVIEIGTPGIYHPGRYNLERMAHGVHFPESTGDYGALLVRSAWFANEGPGINANRPIKPSIRSPVKIVQVVIVVTLVLKTIQDRDGVPVRSSVLVCIRNKGQVRSVPQPDAPVADGNRSK